MIVSPPDLLRLLVVPVFAWAAWRDIETRRLPNRMWAPLVLFGVLLIAWEIATHLPLSTGEDRLYLLRVGLSVGLVVPLSYVFWRLGGFGGADAKALMTLAVVFPTYPVYGTATTTIPLVRTTIGVLSLTILTNTVIVGACYPLALAARNAVSGDFAPVMFLSKRIPVSSLSTVHGRLFETREGYTRRGLDLDALRMYLRWRGATLSTLRDDPTESRNPATIAETFDPTDGAVHRGPATDGGRTVTGDTESTETGDEFDDPWGAEAFFADIDGTAYGTTPESLREGLEVVTTRDVVWVSPGLPFLVPMFVGLLVALTYGDLLFAAMRAIGLA